MHPLPPPEFLTIYQLVKQTGFVFSPWGFSNPTSLGTGFFQTRDEVEKTRTLELLKLPSSDNSLFHVFELQIPNPAYVQSKDSLDL